ncbi:MAG: chloride channel protein [Lewinellaceae bacterium]|nr:chloride channel protein [Phaeodactylibacter sp.]MCB9041086.1 chloride channel protein [Lewinellaceae bacterium]
MGRLQKYYRYLRLSSYRLIHWFATRISNRNYQIIVSIIIGMVSGLVAVGLKFLVFLLKEWIQGSDPTRERLLFVFLPLGGVLCTIAFIRFIVRKPVNPGLSELIYAISQKKVNLPRYETYAHAVSSSLTVGFGGSVGLEAPIIRTGSAIGANLARILQVGRKRQTLFLACGAAAGMSAIFNSPVAGVIFAFEVLLTEMALHSFIPLLISAATGAVVAKLLYYEQLFFLPSKDWAIDGIPFYLILGLLCGLLSVIMIRTNLRITTYFNNLKRPAVKIGLGGLAIGLLIFLMPPLFGEGYETVDNLLAGRFEAMLEHSPFYWLYDEPLFLIVFALAALIAKIFASSITIAIGGNGGVFAPSMFLGATLGFAFAHSINLLDWITLREANFIAVAMAGLLSGVFKSPLTAIFFIAELTGGYGLFVPLMLVSALSYFVSLYFEPHSIFTRELFLKGLWVPPHERDLNILREMNLRGLVETNFWKVHPEMSLGEFVKIIAKSNRNVFPVVDEEGLFKGIVLLDDVREVMFQTDKYDQVFVKDVMHNPPTTIDIHDPMEKVMQQFDFHNAWNLPVADQGKYLGFVSKSSVFNRYRELLIVRSREM